MGGARAVGQYTIENKGVLLRSPIRNPLGSQKSRLAILYLLFSSRGMLSKATDLNRPESFFRPSPEVIKHPRQYLDNLSTEDHRRLTNFWGVDGLNQLLSLAFESDNKIFQQDLLDLGRHLRRRDRMPAALLIFQFMSDHSKGEFSETASQIKIERDAMVGTGALGPRLEFVFEQVGKEIADPALLAAMWSDQFTFSWVRRATALKFLQPTATGSFRVSRAGKIISNLSGFALEVPAFAMTHQGIAKLLGQEARYSDLKGALLGTFFLRGGLWMGGGLGQGLARRLAATGNRLGQRVGIKILNRRYFVSGVSGLGNFLGAYSGLVVAGGAEMAQAYHSPFNLDTLFGESLLTYLHFRAMRL